MMNEGIYFISKLTEVDKSILLNSIAGFIGGLLQCGVEDTFDKFINQKEVSFNGIIQKYVYSGLFSGIMLGLAVFVVFIFDNVTPTENINQLFIPFAIIVLPLITVTNKMLNRIYYQN